MTSKSYKLFSTSIKLWREKKRKNSSISIILIPLNASKSNHFILTKMFINKVSESWKNTLVLIFVVNFLQVQLVVLASKTYNLLTLCINNLVLEWIFTSILWNILLHVFYFWLFLQFSQLLYHVIFLWAMESILFLTIRHFSFQLQWGHFHQDIFTVNIHQLVKLQMVLILPVLS